MMWNDPGRNEAELRHLYAASGTELARQRWPTTPAMLDGAQPHFPICGDGRRANCVVDGDTFWYRGEKIRISDINTPEVSDPDCPREATLGAQATRRLQDLLNQGAFSLGLDPSGRDTDRYGRKLRTVNRDGESLGGRLVDEGLAERWKGRRSSWC
jgi:endonuclease YncB( thermonuclease family)